MPEIVLATLNARYAHAAFGLRYLLANLGELRGRAGMVEFEINQRVPDMLEILLEQGPKIIGLGVYIWNVGPTTQLVADLKRLRPEVVIVLGGPEVSHEAEGQEICRLADYVIQGEGELAFAALCGELLAGRRPEEKIIRAALPQMEQLVLPYDLYGDRDLAQRVIYVEASRGCPFKCEFCLSSLDVPLRNVPLERFLEAMEGLLARGARQFKFVDRTFNLNVNIGRAILAFFLERYRPGMFLHFEMVPDRLPEGLRDLIRRFPPGALQFEVGIQTFNEEVAGRISRRQDNAKVGENFGFLRRETGVHIHADLIAGLPGEDVESFAAGFDRLVALGPQEIQLGILKRLRGAPIARHDREWGMVYSQWPPYEILQTRHMDFATLQRLRRLARYWDLFVNSGNFVEGAALVYQGASPFWAFMALSDWLFGRLGRTHSIALNDLGQHLFEYLTEEQGRDAAEVARAIWRDYQRVGRSDVPGFLRAFVEGVVPARRMPGQGGGASRQARHLAGEMGQREGTPDAHG